MAPDADAVRGRRLPHDLGQHFEWGYIESSAITDEREPHPAGRYRAFDRRESLWRGIPLR
ncbi:hypothetical protein JOF55_003824 [Haloactinomyces albus]|uniref:Uncharacterized protein n=1 Tax=Haloactinomyces albus TaxID=1352928 RepID=A0AAE4CRE6_9ACTN|nr:hypothetical protein [Haloactinomyces albus]